MSRLFDVADVIDGDGRWSGVPYDVTYDAKARPLIVQDICTKANVALVAGSLSAVPIVYTIRPVGAMVSALRPNRCVTPEDFDEFEATLHRDLDFEGNRVAAYVLYNGIPGWTSAQPFLTSSDVATVAAVANDVPATVAAVLDAWYSGEVGESPVLHLGETSAMKLSQGSATSPQPASSEFYLTMDGTPVVVSPVYPTNTVAATGGVIVRRGAIGDLVPAYDYATNRTYFTAVQTLAVEFNANIAVRAT